MPVSITPGYDFSVNAIPTRETLALQAQNLQISGIPLSALDATIVIAAINDSTAATNLPLEGSLWIDARGNVWGKTADGNVRVKRSDGGWESNRFYYDNSRGFMRPGMLVTLEAINANTQVTITNFHWDIAPADPFNHAFGVCQATLHSQASDVAKFIVCCQGRTRGTVLAGSPIIGAAQHYNMSTGAYAGLAAYADFYLSAASFQRLGEGAEKDESWPVTDPRFYFFGLGIPRK